MLRNGALLPEAFWGGSLFPGAPGAHSALGRQRVLGFGSRALLSISVPGSCSLQEERKGAEIIP